MQNFPLKFVLVGDSNVGKSQLSKRFVQNDFSNESVSTVGMQYATKQMPFERCLLNAQIWDLGGQERVAKLSTHFYKDAVGALLVYDICNRNSFEHLRHNWVEQIKEFGHPKIYLILIGNKLDCVNDTDKKRAVSIEEGCEFAKEIGMSYIEVSALSGLNVDIAFRRIIYSVGSLLPPVKVHLDHLALPVGWIVERRASEKDPVNPNGKGVQECLYINYWTGETQTTKPTAPAKDMLLYSYLRKPAPATPERDSISTTSSDEKVDKTKSFGTPVGKIEIESEEVPVKNNSTACCIIS